MTWIEVELMDGPVPAFAERAAEGAGAVVNFAGVVRPEEEGRRLQALSYEDYEPMTTRELTRLAERLGESYGLTQVRMRHSRGRVPVGAVSFRLEIAAPHRQEALTATAEFIDLMKRDVPLWKRPEWLP